VVVGEDSAHRASPCAVVDGGNVEVDTWNQAEHRSHQVVYDNEDDGQASLSVPLCDEVESSMSLRSF
jgi:hypothetical protein